MLSLSSLAEPTSSGKIRPCELPRIAPCYAVDELRAFARSEERACMLQLSSMSVWPVCALSRNFSQRRHAIGLCVTPADSQQRYHCRAPCCSPRAPAPCNIGTLIVGQLGSSLRVIRSTPRCPAYNCVERSVETESNSQALSL